MKDNLIIVTTGSSGSSVLAGLIGAHGYYLGDETMKLSFDTYENSRLVELNMALFKMIGFERGDANDMPPPDTDALAALAPDTDIFERFVDACLEKEPFLWKDPRLAYTLHFWQRFEPIRKAKFIFIRRDPVQSYAGLILSRKTPMSMKEQAQMNLNYALSFQRFVEKHAPMVYECLFEDLILEPGTFLTGLNEYLGCRITMDDLRGIYHGRLHRLRYSKWDVAKARVMYLLYRYVKRDFVTFPRGNSPKD